MRHSGGAPAPTGTGTSGAAGTRLPRLGHGALVRSGTKPPGSRHAGLSLDSRSDLAAVDPSSQGHLHPAEPPTRRTLRQSLTLDRCSSALAASPRASVLPATSRQATGDFVVDRSAAEAASTVANQRRRHRQSPMPRRIGDAVAGCRTSPFAEAGRGSARSWEVPSPDSTGRGPRGCTPGAGRRSPRRPGSRGWPCRHSRDDFELLVDPSLQVAVVSRSRRTRTLPSRTA